jgi:hypothetical protein
MGFTSFLFRIGSGKACLLELAITALPAGVAVEDPELNGSQDVVDEVDQALVVGIGAGDKVVLKGGFFGLQQDIVSDQARILGSRHFHFGHGIGIGGGLEVVFKTEG